MRLLCTLGVAFTAAGCMQPARYERSVSLPAAPEEFVRQALANLKGDRFRFRWDVVRSAGGLFGEVTATFEGERIWPDAVHVMGEWRFDGEVEEEELYGVGDLQYRRAEDGRGWSSGSREEASDPLRQLEVVLGEGPYSFEGEEHRRGRTVFVFTFEPNLALLDPSLTKSVEGRLWIEAERLVPERLLAQETGSGAPSIRWEMSFWDIGGSFDLHLPEIGPRHQIVLEPQSHEIERGESELLTAARAVIEARCRSYAGGGDFDVRLVGRRIVIDLANVGAPFEIAQIAARPGSLALWVSRWPGEPVITLRTEGVEARYGRGSVLAFERERVSRPIVLQHPLLEVGHKYVRNARVVFDDLSRPLVEIGLDRAGAAKLREDRELVGRPLAIVIDGEVIDAPIVRGAESEVLRFGLGLRLPEVQALVAILSADPLSLSLAVREVGVP